MEIETIGDTSILVIAQSAGEHGAAWPAIVCLVVGLVLWLFGRRMLRPAIVTLALILGGSFGWSIGAIVDTAVPPWAFALVGAGLAMLLGWAAHRAAVIVLMAGLFGAPGGAIIALGAQHLGWIGESPSTSKIDSPAAATPTTLETQDETDGLPADLAQFVRLAIGNQYRTSSVEPDSLDEGSQPMPLVDAPEVDEPAQEQGDELRHQMKSIYHLLAEQWAGLEPGVKRTAAIGAVIGVLAGVGMGMIASSLSTLITTAVIGAALMLLGGWGLLDRLESDRVSAALPSSVAVWAMLWLITSIIGAVIQWTTRPQAVDKPG